MNFTKKMMSGVNRFKPALKKMIPASLLHRSKQIVLNRISNQIEQVSVEPYDASAFQWGMNLIGPIDSATGLGQSLRLIEHVVAQMDIPYMIYNYAQNTRNRIQISEYEKKINTELKYAVNLWHVNPSEFAEMYACMGKTSFNRRYNIAYWLWELEDFPDEWVTYINLLDEIWTPSDFISESIRKKTDKPVYTVPYHITAPSDCRKYGRDYFGLPEDKFLFLMMYDAQSISERKNPDGVIRAFQLAFPPEQSNVGLVIKVNSADQGEVEKLCRRFKGYKNVYLIQQNMEKIQVNSLIASVDVFVSLHRAEGFGLVLAEAMLNHVPTIATNWSANTEFMNFETACMVSFEMKTLETDILPYKKGNKWANPDIDEAAMYMKKLVQDPVYYMQLSDNAYDHVSKWLGLERIQKIFNIRLQEIKDGR